MTKQLLVPVKALIVVTKEGTAVRVLTEKPVEKPKPKQWMLPGGYL